MREIKFRVWDEDNNELVYEVGITPEGIPYTIPDYAENSDQFNYYPSCHKMQYTGVKDKNGTEIYDEDIVKYTERNLENAFGGKGEPQEEKKRIVRWFMDGWVIPKGFVKDIEVIGNCYENPELVEDK